MKSLMVLLARGAFVLAVAGAFTFGGIQAVESARDGCNWAPPDELGECHGEDDPFCQQRCEEWGGFQGKCAEDKRPGVYCCYCAL
jgi:hypothetical protein